jgi:hypothetical protein
MIRFIGTKKGNISNNEWLLRRFGNNFIRCSCKTNLDDRKKLATVVRRWMRC